MGYKAFIKGLKLPKQLVYLQKTNSSAQSSIFSLYFCPETFLAIKQELNFVFVETAVVVAALVAVGTAVDEAFGLQTAPVASVVRPIPTGEGLLFAFSLRHQPDI